MEKHRGTRTKLVIFRLFHSYAGYDPRHSGESINLSKFFSFSNTIIKGVFGFKKIAFIHCDTVPNGRVLAIWYFESRETFEVTFT